MSGEKWWGEELEDYWDSGEEGEYSIPIYHTEKKTIVGYIAFRISAFPSQCGIDLMENIAFPNNFNITREEAMECFSTWIYNSEEGKAARCGKFQVPPNNILWIEEDRPCRARYILSDAANSAYHTKLFAYFCGLDEFPAVRNPNSGNLINHWFFDMVDSVPVENFWDRVSNLPQ